MRLSSIIFVFLPCVGCALYTSAKRDKVLMVSFDGYRWDYPELFNTPNFHKMRTEGVTARRGLKPVFVTNTFPNHFSIVTGVYAEKHGIVDNNMFNQSSNEEFSIRQSSDPKWWQDGKPIWITAEAQGIRTGVYFWVGSEIEIGGQRPSYFKTYNGSVPFRTRVDQVINWLKDDLVDMALLYFDEPDSTGHAHGIKSSQLKVAVENVSDTTLGYLLSQLDASKLSDKVNLLVVSDHGMTNFEKKIISLTDYVNSTLLKKVVPSLAPTVGIFPQNGVDPDAIYQKLKNASPHIKVYLKEDIPEHFHYKRHERIAPLLVTAHEGYLVSMKSRSSNLVGYHGYSNDLQSMRPAFVARGPAFKKNFNVEQFSILDIYPLLCQLTGIKPEPNDGGLDVVQTLLLSSASLSHVSIVSFLLIPVLMIYNNLSLV